MATRHKSDLLHEPMSDRKLLKGLLSGRQVPTFTVHRSRFELGKRVIDSTPQDMEFGHWQVMPGHVVD